MSQTGLTISCLLGLNCFCFPVFWQLLRPPELLKQRFNHPGAAASTSSLRSTGLKSLPHFHSKEVWVSWPSGHTVKLSKYMNFRWTRIDRLWRRRFVVVGYAGMRWPKALAGKNCRLKCRPWGLERACGQESNTVCLSQHRSYAVMAVDIYILFCAQKGQQMWIWSAFCISPRTLSTVLHMALLPMQRVWFSHLHLTLICHAVQPFLLKEEILRLPYLPSS